MTESTEVATAQPSGLEAFVGGYRQDIADLLPAHIDPARFVRWSLGYIRQRPRLLECRPETLLVGLLDCARLGLELGTTYHLVPFKGVATGITDYKGELELIARARVVQSVHAQLVREKDDFEFQPGSGRITHEADWFSEDRGLVQGGYAFGVLQDGSHTQTVLMTVADFDRHKAASKFGNDPSSPWQVWEESMQLKTLVHQLRKWVPWSAEWVTL